ncbi:MAG: hypothetical protein LUQ27_00015 [Methanomassiliicoccales archaeon]|nr:hypothetical protein [Methanomassiliicoccales archaeon]
MTGLVKETSEFLGGHVIEVLGRCGENVVILARKVVRAISLGEKNS